MNESPLSQLRRVTRDQHERVEELARQLGVLTSRTKFTRHLQVLWHHHQTELQRLVEHEDLHARVAQRVSDIAHDIRHLGGLVPAYPSTTHEGVTNAAATGATYVIEGSRLGAHAIAKLLEKNGVSTQGLVSVGGDLGAIRGDFQDLALRINQVAPQDVGAMAFAAATSFEDLLAAYESWLSEALPSRSHTG